MRTFLVALLVGLALLISAFVLGVASRTALSAPTAPAQDATPRLAPWLGVSVALEQGDAQQRAATLDAIASAGFGWVRQRFPWDAIEPQPGKFVWEPWDAIVDDIAQHHLTLVAVLDGSPAWARAPSDADNPLAPPQHNADFGRLAQAFAARYGPKVQVYQVWDEPNIRPHWGQGLVNAAAYAGLLREAAVQLRATDPDAVILAAALAPNVEPGGVNQSDVAYLDGLYQAGAAPWFDAVAAQPYGFAQPPAASPAPEALNFRRVELLRDVMVRHGDGDKALWAVAYGWHAPIDGQDPGASPWKSVDQATQAAWAVDAARWAQLEWPWLGGLAWAWWQPPQPAGDPHWGLALVTPEGGERPVLQALRAWVQEPSVLTPGQWPPDGPAVQEEGGWRLTNQAADPPRGARAGNNRLTVPFEGTGLALNIQRGPYWGYFDITIDGQPAPALPKDGDGRAILVLHDPLAGQETVVLANRLVDGQHVAEIVATGGWDQWPLLGIEVWRNVEAPRAGLLPWWLAAAGLVLAGFGSAGLLLTRRPGTRHAAQIPLGRALERAQQAPAWLRYGLLALVVLMCGLAPPWLQLPAIGALVAILVVFPETGPALLAFLAPLFLVKVTVLGRAVNPAEIAGLLAVLALAVRWILEWMARRSVQHTPAPSNGTEHRSAVPVSAPSMAGAGTRGALRFLPLDWPVLALLVVAGVSLVGALNGGVAVHEFRTVIVAGVIAYGLVRLNPARAPDGRFDPFPVVWGLAAGASVVAGWGIFQAVTGAQLIAAEGVLRVRGPYGSPNNLALYLDHVLPMLLAIALLGHERGRRIAAGVLSLIVLAGLVLTFSRGALLLGLPAALVFLGFAAGGRWRWITLALLVAGLALLLPLFQTERFAGLLNLQTGTGFFRLQLWRGAWNMILEHPWLGVGLDNFLYAYRTRYVTPAGWQELNLSHPHNIVLDFWTRLGVLGLLAGLWLFVAAFWQGWRARRHLSGDRLALLLGLLASLVATIAHGAIDNSVFLVDLMLVFMLSLGLISRLGQDPTSRD